MGIFTRSFDKPGPGVDPDAPQKRSFFRFFDIFFRKFWHFVKANMLYALTMIPTFIIVMFLSTAVIGKLVESAGMEVDADGIYMIIILCSALFANLFAALWGMGPATAGMTYIMRNFAREEHAWLWSDFKDSLKNNFKQSIIVFGIDILMFVLFYSAIVVYSSMEGFMAGLKYVIYLIIFVYTIMHMYIYPMMITFDLSLRNLYRNALLFALGKLPSNLLVLLILVGINIGLPFAAVIFGGQYYVIMLLVLVLLNLMVGHAFSLFLVNFNAYPKLKQYMIDPNSDGTAEVKARPLSEDPDVFNNENEE